MSLVLWSVNIAKINRPVITLPLVAACLDISKEYNFEKKKARWIWVYNALCNVTHLHIACCLSLPFSDRIAKWESWGYSTLYTVLHALRTGYKTPEINAILQTAQQGDIYSAAYRRGMQRAPMSQLKAWDWEQVYHNLLRIADRYRLTKWEFGYYSTVPSSPSHREITQSILSLFYPLSAPSRSHRMELGESPTNSSYSAQLNKKSRQ